MYTYIKLRARFEPAKIANLNALKNDVFIRFPATYYRRFAIVNTNFMYFDFDLDFYS